MAVTVDEPLGRDVSTWAERALVRTRGDTEEAAEVLAAMLRDRPELLRQVAGAVVRSVQRAQIWKANGG